MGAEALREQRISIHAPRAGSDFVMSAKKNGVKRFQSTLPVRGATKIEPIPYRSDYISIHAPRAGSDLKK